ncbi:treslin isoform X2 [Emydura macquarii macquarii]|uniref:treslin isoform X2 n=1 Tax=Emydura macquarii macquarii TaxID=1129001 RepID=UPI003529D72B
MTCSHHVVFLLDVASPVQKNQLQLGCLRILNYSGCRFGLANVRWGYKFFDSLGARGRASRLGDFCELGPRSFEDFAEELESRFGVQSHKSHLPGPVPRAILTQNVLKETLLDYPWDRPEITSPAKPFLRSQKSRLIVAPDEPLESHMPSEGFVNAVFLFSPCPHSQRELLQFVSGSDVHSSCNYPSSQEVAEKLLPKRVQEMIAGQKITLYWVDTAEWFKVLESPDHVGYWTMSELIHLVGGTIVPSETLIHGLSHYRTEAASLFCRESSSSKLQFMPRATILPFDSTLNFLLSKPSLFQASFPQQEGALFLSMHGVEKQWRCAVILEPIAMNQRCFQSPVSIFLKGTLTDWNLTVADNFLTESWILQSSRAGQLEQDALFQQLVRRLITEELHMVAEVSSSEFWSPCTGILSPLSDTAAVLTLFCTEKATEVQRCLPQGAVTASSSQDYTFHLPEIVSSVLSQADTLIKDDLASSDETTVPEWVQHELSCTDGWNPAVVERWYSLSDICGASPDLMESFRLLQAVSATEKEEASQPEMELTHCLSEFYQRKSSEASATAEPRDHKKRWGVPRTPVRQKMKTMSRSLQMLNVARLNVKAQKFLPDGVPPAAGEKLPQKLLWRSDDKLEEKRRVLKISIDFKTEEEMLSHLTANYQEAVVNGEFLTFVCARNMVTAIKRFLKPKDVKEREVACMDRVRSHLLKTSKTLRQQYDVNPDKETKVRECQLQVFLRLELCLQCPSLQSSTDEMEQLVEEMTDMLRILCLTEDPGYLTKFLEEVVVSYMDSIPKTLGCLYYSLGTQIPPKLASVLPADFFSDDSMTLSSRSPSLPPSVTSVPVPSTASISTETDQLEELRTRSAKKRRNNALARHRSMTETSQNLRQIEIPQIPKNTIRKENSHSYFATEKAQQQVLPQQKEAVQEVTKVRRNLFNEEMLSPSKKSLKKMLRSQSVSAVEGLRHKRSCSDEGSRDHRKLLTKKVSETPLHKQVSRRLLHKQIKGRCSDPGSDIHVVEESPEKTTTVGLRRSPRIKQLSLNRTHSGSFYSTAQPSSRNMQRVHLVQQEVTCVKQDLTGIPRYPDNLTIQSPKRLLFGAVLQVSSPKVKDSAGTRRTRNNSDLEEPIAYQTPRKTPHKAAQKPLTSTSRMLRKSPRTPHKTSKTLEKTPGKSPAAKQTATKCLGRYFSPSRQDKSPPEPSEKTREHLSQVTPQKDCFPERFPSPYKEVGLQTPEKQTGDKVLDDVFGSPLKDFSPATASCTAAQMPCTAKEKSISDPQTQRRSLRSSQKTASPASIPRQALGVESQRNPEPNFHLESVSHPVEATPRKVRCAAPKPLSPVGVVAAALSSEAQATLSTKYSFNSSPFESSIQTPAIGSPPHCKTTELDWESNTPKKPPLKSQNITGTSPRKALRSPTCTPEHTKRGEVNPALSLSKSAKNKEKHHSKGITRLPAQSSLLYEPKASESVCMLEKSELVCIDAQGSSPRKDQSLEKHLSPELSAQGHVHVLDVVRVHKHFDSSSLGSRSIFETLPDRQSDASGVRVLPSEEFKESKMFTVKPSGSNFLNALPATSKCASSAYALRCTPDRMQREAAARLGNPELQGKLSTPKSQKKLVSTNPPTYEVELEMQASGLPKLRIKRIGSGSALEVQSQLKTGKSSGEESPFTELAVACCARHPGKLAAACVSPSCFRSSHSTPGKGGGQTYICQSYTPTSCASTTTSPSHVDAGVPWTPSPKHKGKTTPDAIKDWPRRKKAADSNASGGCGRSEKNAECTGNMSASEEGGTTSDHCSISKALLLMDFELEGVYRLHDQSPPSDTEPQADEGSSTGTFGLKSRKRAFDHRSPEEESKQEAKRSCTTRDYLDPVSSSTDESSTSKRRVSTMPPGRTTVSSNRTPGQQSSIGDDDVFSVSGSTPPLKGSLSASGLRALTQSPLLYQGQTPSRKKCARGNHLSFHKALHSDYRLVTCLQLSEMERAQVVYQKGGRELVCTQKGRCGERLEDLMCLPGRLLLPRSWALEP